MVDKLSKQVKKQGDMTRKAVADIVGTTVGVQIGQKTIVDVGGALPLGGDPSAIASAERVRASGSKALEIVGVSPVIKAGNVTLKSLDKMSNLSRKL